MMRSWRGQAEGWEAKIRRSWDNAYSAMSSYMSGSSNSSRGQTAQIPFMITVQTKQELADLGYEREAVRSFTPPQALDIIRNRRKASSFDSDAATVLVYSLALAGRALLPPTQVLHPPKCCTHHSEGRGGTHTHREN